MIDLDSGCHAISVILNRRKNKRRHDFFKPIGKEKYPRRVARRGF